MTITITGSVGKDGINRHHDVEIVQTLINRQAKSIAPLRPLRVDGVVGARTIAAIEAYQRNVLSEAEPDGLVDTNGKTIRSLRSAAPGASAIPFCCRARWLMGDRASWLMGIRLSGALSAAPMMARRDNAPASRGGLARAS